MVHADICQTDNNSWGRHKARRIQAIMSQFIHLTSWQIQTRISDWYCFYVFRKHFPQAMICIHNANNSSAKGVFETPCCFNLIACLLSQCYPPRLMVPTHKLQDLLHRTKQIYYLFFSAKPMEGMHLEQWESKRWYIFPFFEHPGKFEQKYPNDVGFCHQRPSLPFKQRVFITHAIHRCKGFETQQGFKRIVYLLSRSNYTGSWL